MKRYQDYTKEEMAELTTEEVNRLIELEIAYEGIIPVEEPELKKVPTVDIKPSIEAYSVYGLYFKDSDKAHTLAELDPLEDAYDYSLGSEYKYLKKKESLICTKGVEKVKFYDKNELTKISSLLKEKKDVEKQNESASQEWEEYNRSIQSIRDGVWDFYYKACNAKSKLETAQKHYEHHKVLADGNEEIAQNFFKEAYKDFPEILEKVIGYKE